MPDAGGAVVAEGRRRSASIGRAVAALGLALFFAGLVLLGAAGLDVYRQAAEVETYAALRIPGYAIPAGGLVLAGIVLNRFGRLFASH